ncbi:PREDICTED: probable salivary secreted peptide [Trachymyrmex cornetzi]|uniref:probable salivary secreted peptide n=1 Tax=Trachymyrmex cornetzi TaxID=471704 RepID=UPI00084F4B51|nr:PREDICTED: probable salivary secreted peptide [Trachymyrmex cornetzi]
MSAYKYIIGLTVLVAALLTITTVPSANGAISSYADNNKSHHLIVGYRMPGDRIVLRENIIKNSSWMKIQIIERTFNISRYERITYIEALDQKTNGNGAHCSILNGGPGHSNVTLRWKSLRGHSINFALNVYGRP